MKWKMNCSKIKELNKILFWIISPQSQNPYKSSFRRETLFCLLSVWTIDGNYIPLFILKFIGDVCKNIAQMF